MAVPAGIGENLASQPDQTSCRYVKLQPNTARSVVYHLHHLAFAAAELLDDDAQKRFRTIDDKQFQRLVDLDR